MSNILADLDIESWWKIPTNPLDCLGFGLAISLSLGRLAVVLQYWRITKMWLAWESDHGKGGTEGGRWIPTALAWTFRVCAIGGYGLMALTIFWPILYYVVLLFAILDVIVSEWFIRASRGYRFMAAPSDIELASKFGRVIEEKQVDVDQALAILQKHLK